MSRKIKIEDVKNTYAIVDDEDYKTLSRYHWFIYIGGYTYNPDLGQMHRFILNATNPDLVVDHINHDRLDNRRENLRICTQQQNQFNRSVRRDNKTGYKGVKTHKWFCKKEQRYKYKCGACMSSPTIGARSSRIS